MITVSDVVMAFGGFRAVDGASLTIPEGSITGLVGPNGAGKTTLFNVIAGNLRPTSGTVTMAGRDITGLRPHELFRLGLLRTFQIAHEFSSMTVRENLMTVPPGQLGEGIWNTWLHRRAIAEEERRLAERADEVLEFLTIDHLAEEKAGNLSGGQKKLLELGRTMMTDARIVFLDEVGAGVNRTLLATIGDAIEALRQTAEQAPGVDAGRVEDVVAVLRRGLDAADVTGRPLSAGMRDLPWPAPPLAQLWHACTWLREHRGDSHVAACVAAGLDGVQANLLTEMAVGWEPLSYTATRGWSPEAMAAGIDALEQRGLVADGALTEEGRRLRVEVEETTDRLVQPVVDAMGDDLPDVVAWLDGWAQPLVDAGAVPPDPYKRASG